MQRETEVYRRRRSNREKNRLKKLRHGGVERETGKTTKRWRCKIRKKDKRKRRKCDERKMDVRRERWRSRERTVKREGRM